MQLLNLHKKLSWILEANITERLVLLKNVTALLEYFHDVQLKVFVAKLCSVFSFYNDVSFYHNLNHILTDFYETMLHYTCSCAHAILLFHGKSMNHRNLSYIRYQIKFHALEAWFALRRVRPPHSVAKDNFADEYHAHSECMNPR